MRTIGTYELKSHLSEVLDAVEKGQTVVVTRHGRSIARIVPDAEEKRKQANESLKTLLNIPLTRLPKGVTIKSLIEEGRR